MVEHDRGSVGAGSTVSVWIVYVGAVAPVCVIAVALLALAIWGQFNWAEQRFRAEASNRFSLVTQHLATTEAVLRGMETYFHLNEDHDDPQARRYAERILLQNPFLFRVEVTAGLPGSDLTPARVDALPVFRVTRLAGGGLYWQGTPIRDLKHALASSETVRVPMFREAADELDALRQARLMASELGSVVVSPVFETERGELAYILCAPVKSQHRVTPRGYVELTVRLKDLLSDHIQLEAGESLSIAVQDAGAASSSQWRMQGKPPAPLLLALFPRLQAERTIYLAGQGIEMTAARQLDLAVIPVGMRWAALMGYLVALGLSLGLARLYIKREGERRHSAASLFRMANYDVLTGLPNRRLFNDRLGRALLRAGRRDRRLAVYFLDLDGFKVVNDTGGHEAGDELLRQVAERLRQALRAEDTVARFAGDEFTVISEGHDDRHACGEVLNKLQYCFVEPFAVAGHEYLVTASIGMAVYPDDGASVDALINHADQAMYLYKHPDWLPLSPEDVRSPDACT